jgi:RHS repeat-associated protein
LNAATTVYDKAGRVIATINGNGNITSNVWDAGGRQVALVDANARRTTFSYDAAGHRTREMNPQNGVITTSYDPAGNVRRVLDPRGQGPTNTYDPANRVIAQFYTDGARFTYTYDSVGNRLTAESDAGAFTTTYEPRNLPLRVAEPGGKIVTYVYDAATRRTAMSAYGKGIFTYGYDEAGRQTRVVTPQSHTTTMGYDAADRLIRRDYGNGAVTTMTYDPAGNVEQITNRGAAGALVSQLSYVYNKADRRTAQRDADSTVTTWSYDRAYQLINERRAGGPVNTSFNVTHVYDPAGNRTVQVAAGVRTTYTYSPANRLTLANTSGALTTYVHDPAGNRLSEQSATRTVFYTWDASGQMVSAETMAGPVNFTYNADGQRVAKQTTDGSAVGFLYDFKRLLHETDEVGGAISRTFASDTTDEFGDLIGEEGESVHQYDALANTEALLDDLGQVEARYKYTAFGEVAAVSVENGPWSVNDWPDLPPQLTTQMLAGGKKHYYLDSETSLYLLGSGNTDGGGRYYDAATARFTSEDPDRHAGDDTNLFAYTGNSPTNELDPSGHRTREEDKEEERKRLERERQQAEDAKRQAEQQKKAGAAATRPADSGEKKGEPERRPLSQVSREAAGDKEELTAKVNWYAERGIDIETDEATSGLAHRTAQQVYDEAWEAINKNGVKDVPGWDRETAVFQALKEEYATKLKWYSNRDTPVLGQVAMSGRIFREEHGLPTNEQLKELYETFPAAQERGVNVSTPVVLGANERSSAAIRAHNQAYKRWLMGNMSPEEAKVELAKYGAGDKPRYEFVVPHNVREHSSLAYAVSILPGLGVARALGPVKTLGQAGRVAVAAGAADVGAAAFVDSLDRQRFEGRDPSYAQAAKEGVAGAMLGALLGGAIGLAAYGLGRLFKGVMAKVRSKGGGEAGAKPMESVRRRNR